MRTCVIKITLDYTDKINSICIIFFNPNTNMLSILFWIEYEKVLKKNSDVRVTHTVTKEMIT